MKRPFIGIKLDLIFPFWWPSSVSHQGQYLSQHRTQNSDKAICKAILTWTHHLGGQQPATHFSCWHCHLISWIHYTWPIIKKHPVKYKAPADHPPLFILFKKAPLEGEYEPWRILNREAIHSTSTEEKINNHAIYNAPADSEVHNFFLWYPIHKMKQLALQSQERKKLCKPKRKEEQLEY